MKFVLLVSCDDLNDPEQPMRCGLLRTFICSRFSNIDEAVEKQAQPNTHSPTWLGYCNTDLFTSASNAAEAHDFNLQRTIIGKPAYEAIWQTRARCNSTTSRELIKTTGLVFGHVHTIGPDNKTAYLRLTEEFINSEGFSRGRWSTAF